jgi:hypothetical protein
MHGLERDESLLLFLSGQRRCLVEQPAVSVHGKHAIVPIAATHQPTIEHARPAADI